MSAVLLEPTTWRDHAACIGEPIGTFYASDRGGHGSYDRAGMLCSSCPVRRACLVDVLAEERGLIRTLRAGFRGGTTPLERWTLERGATA